MKQHRLMRAHYKAPCSQSCLGSRASSPCRAACRQGQPGPCRLGQLNGCCSDFSQLPALGSVKLQIYKPSEQIRVISLYFTAVILGQGSLSDYFSQVLFCLLVHNFTNLLKVRSLQPKRTAAILKLIPFEGVKKQDENSFGYHAIFHPLGTLIILPQAPSAVNFLHQEWHSVGLSRLQQALHRASSCPCMCPTLQGGPALGKPDSTPLPGS